ncbi:MAG TPA: segregation/condensation protein A [Erysipelotrichaceae bacterium]|nr:segregation/condensation protein A [Erysipelotrichaceae bacterium]
MGFEVAINEFEGPLDLMLHLIREQELDLFDLDITILVDQYIAYINAAKEVHLEIASEYLTMLATLIEFKSKKLLPKNKEVLDGEFEEDPQELLVKRLLEYQQFKEVSEVLENRYNERIKQVASSMEPVAEVWLKDVEIEDLEGDVSELYKAMTKVMQRISLDNPFQTKVTRKEVSVDERVISINERFKDRHTSFTFSSVVSDTNDLQVFVVSFLAILDMIRLNLLTFVIDDKSEIWLKWSDIDG